MRVIMRLVPAPRLAFSFLLAIACVPGAEASPGPDRLGKVDFPTTCSAGAEPAIEKGVALLHSFQYTEADQTFTDAASRDPHCAMAHWGKAMSLYYQLWEFPSDKRLRDGRKEMERARKLGPATAREQGFVEAASLFFQKKKTSHLERIKAYSGSLEKFYAQHPGDVEIGSFYALSLVALGYEKESEGMPYFKQAVAILDPLVKAHPDHPGAAHYLIHAADRPELAPEGLEAARLYAGIAPDSSHALHMPSHIFARLGLWQDSIASNMAAEASGAHAAEMHHAEYHYQTHAMDFLSYSFLQSGQEAKAREVIEQATKVVGASDEQRARTRAYLAARTALELHRWKEAAALPAPPWPTGGDTTILARAIGAAHLGDVAEAASAVKQLSEHVAEREREARKGGYSVSGEKAADLREAEAWLAFAKGKAEEALAELGAAADHEDKNGVDSISMPAREMLADMLMELKRPNQALAEYKTSLQHSPNRFDGLLGAARASQAAGDSASAQSFYARLAEACGAGADRPEVTEAKTFLARK